MTFTPFTKPTDTIQSLSDRPNQTDGLTAAQLKIKFDQGMIDTKDYTTGLLAELASTTSTSGASNIGNKTITGIVGNDLQTTLEALKVLIDLKSNLTDVYSKTNLDSGQLDNRYYTETELINGALDGLYATLSNTYTKSQVDAIVAGVILGQIGDGSITDVKLSNAVGDIKERLTSSLAEMETQVGDIATLSTTDKTSLVNAINENFTNANNGKQNWVDVVGSPLVNTDAFATLKSKTQTLKDTMASNLTAKGQSSVGTESLTGLVDKVALVSTGKKWASGSLTTVLGEASVFHLTNGNAVTRTVVNVTGLNFTPSIIYMYNGLLLIGTFFTILKDSTKKYCLTPANEKIYVEEVGTYADGLVKYGTFFLPAGSTASNVNWIAYE